MGFPCLRPALCGWVERQRGGGSGWRGMEGKKTTTCRTLRREMSGVVTNGGRESIGLETLLWTLPSYFLLRPKTAGLFLFFFFLYFNLTYSRWTSSLPSCLWSQRIFPSLSGSRLTFFYRNASSALLQLVNQWLNFTYSRSHAFRYERNNTNPTLVRIELTTSALAGVQVTC